MKAAHKGANKALPLGGVGGGFELEGASLNSQFLNFRLCSTLPIVGADPCVRPMSERHISTGLASVVRLSALGRHMGLPLQVAV